MRILKLFFFLMVPSVVLAQVDSLAAQNGDTGIPADILEGFTSLSALAVLIASGEELIQKWWKLRGWASKIRTWVIGLGLAAVGHFINAGLFADAMAPDWWPAFGGSLGFALVLGFLCALAANFGFKNWDGVRIILIALGVRVATVKDKAALTKIANKQG